MPQLARQLPTACPCTGNVHICLRRTSFNSLPTAYKRTRLSKRCRIDADERMARAILELTKVGEQRCEESQLIDVVEADRHACVRAEDFNLKQNVATTVFFVTILTPGSFVQQPMAKETASVSEVIVIPTAASLIASTILPSTVSSALVRCHADTRMNMSSTPIDMTRNGITVVMRLNS